VDKLVKDLSSRKKRNHVRLERIGTYQSPSEPHQSQQDPARSDRVLRDSEGRQVPQD
jgi:hypothetical protein